VVDGYDGESQVPELSSRPFYDACWRRLDGGGVLVVNLWGSDRRFNEYLQRIEAAFPAGTLCLPAERPGNVIVFAFRDPPGSPRWDELAARARELEGRYGLEFGQFVRNLRKMNRSDGTRLHISPLSTDA
jgi:spermidine synthase